MVSVWCVQIPCCLPRFFLCVGRVEGMIPSRKGHSEALDFSISGWSRPKCCGLCCALCPSSTGAWPLKMGESWQLKTIGCFKILKKCHSNGWFATESWSHLHVVLLFVAFWVKPPIQSSRTVGVICPSHPVRCENRDPKISGPCLEIYVQSYRWWFPLTCIFTRNTSHGWWPQFLSHPRIPSMLGAMERSHVPSPVASRDAQL